MAQVYGHRTHAREEPPRQAGRTFRLLFCAFLFTLAAVCKNVLPDGYRRALVVGIDSGLTLREVLELFGESAGSREILSELWNEGVLRVFGGGEQEVAGEIGALPAAPAETREPEAKRMDLTASVMIPVFSVSEIRIDEGVLPGGAQDPESADPPAAAEETEPDEPPLPDEDAEEEAPEERAEEDGPPLPAIVSTEAVSLPFPYQTPVSGPLTSGFGYRTHPLDGEYKFHYGVDLAVPTGTDVACFADGRVACAGWGDINGWYVKVEHEDGFTTLYAHLDEILVKDGETVQRGGTLGKSGETGDASGPHLHFQLYHRGRLVDPAPFLEFEA